MHTFVGRAAEQQALRDRLRRPSSFALIYGQRRTGKTFLLQRTLADERDMVYFMADETTAATLLSRFWAELTAAGRAPLVTRPSEWGAALTLAVQQSVMDGRRLILVLDECQYLLEAEPSLASILQRLWDQHRHRGGLHLILCGSALGVMERLGDVSQPLHGRFDLKIKLRAFDYRESADFVRDWSPLDQLRLFGVFGGLARHLAEVDPTRSLMDNAVCSILNPLGPLHDAAPELLRTERLSARTEADAVLEAVAGGEVQFNAIAARAGITASRADYVIKELLALEILRRDTRFGDREGSRYARYRCADPFTTFWFRFVAPNRSALHTSAPERVWQQRIAPRLDDHMGPVFEQIARQAVLRGVLGPALVDEVAGWWSRDGQTEIDLIVRCSDTLRCCECKWRGGGQVDLAALRQLRDHIARHPTLSASVPLALVSAGTFVDRLRQVASAEDVVLVGLDHLFLDEAAQ